VVIKTTADKADGLPVMEVGEWANDKHAILARYIDASRGARAKFPKNSFVDVFCGPGRVQPRDSGNVQDGGAVAAYKMALQGGAGFSKMYVSDLSPDFSSACQSRLATLGATVVVDAGTAEMVAPKFARQLDQFQGLHLIYADPCNMESMPFKVFQPFFFLKRVDFIIHFSTNDLQRNIEGELAKESSYLDDFAPGWRAVVRLESPATMRGKFFEYWASLFAKEGFKLASHIPLIVNTNKAPLYRLVMFSRHPLADKLWIATSGANKQPDLFGD
jgi:three-Cys-motif partner protein